MERKTASASTIRSINRSAILDFIRKNKSTSCTQIARKLSVSQPTVIRIVDDLIRHNFVRSAGFSQETSVGRPHAMVEFNGSAHSVIGLDLGGPRLLAAETDLSGNMQNEFYIPYKHARGEDNLQEVVQLVQKLIDSPRPEGQRLLGVGVGVPGVTLYDKGIVTWAASLNWKDLPLREILQGYFDVPVFIENDVNLAALGEVSFGAGVGVHNLVCLSIGNGIGGGILVEDTLYRGYNQAAGEVGYLPPGLQFLGQSFPEFGALESLAANEGIVRRAQEILMRSDSDGHGRDLSAADIFRAAKAGEEWAQTVIDEITDYLAFAAACLSSILNPELITLGGGLSEHMDTLIEPIRSRIDGLVPYSPRLVISPLGNKAAVMGVINLVLTEVMDLVVVRSLL